MQDGVQILLELLPLLPVAEYECHSHSLARPAFHNSKYRNPRCFALPGNALWWIGLLQANIQHGSDGPRLRSENGRSTEADVLDAIGQRRPAVPVIRNQRRIMADGPSSIALREQEPEDFRQPIHLRAPCATVARCISCQRAFSASGGQISSLSPICVREEWIDRIPNSRTVCAFIFIGVIRKGGTCSIM